METIKCSICGNEIKCPACGESIKTKEAIQSALDNHMYFCPMCGNEIASTLVKALAKSEN